MKSKTRQTRRLGASSNVALGLALLMGTAVPGFCASPTIPGVATNYVLVTNVVVVTNYVITTRVILTTNTVAIGATDSALPDLDWVPPADRFDWIQLKSGEWLKGQLKAMQDRKLEFESEELNDLKFDWKDIRQVRSPRTLDVLSNTGQKVSGPVAITPVQVTVGGESPRVIPREQLQSVTPGGNREWNYWSGKLTLSLTMRKGNTESVEYNAQAHLQRRTPATRFSFDYIGNVSSVDGVESANNNRFNTEFDYWLSRRFYLVLPYTEYYQDPFQNLAHRLTLGAGVGYDLIDRPNLNWNITTGPAYQLAWFESAAPGAPTQKGTAALWLASRFEWDLTQRIKWILEYRGQYTSKEVGETTHHSVSTLSLELTKRFDLDLSLVWDRIAQPKVGANGIQPKRDDFRLVVGLGVDF